MDVKDVEWSAYRAAVLEYTPDWYWSNVGGDNTLHFTGHSGYIGAGAPFDDLTWAPSSGLYWKITRSYDGPSWSFNISNSYNTHLFRFGYSSYAFINYYVWAFEVTSFMQDVGPATSTPMADVTEWRQYRDADGRFWGEYRDPADGSWQPVYNHSEYNPTQAAGWSISAEFGGNIDLHDVHGFVYTPDGPTDPDPVSSPLKVKMTSGTWANVATASRPLKVKMTDGTWRVYAGGAGSPIKQKQADGTWRVIARAGTAVVAPPRSIYGHVYHADGSPAENIFMQITRVSSPNGQLDAEESLSDGSYSFPPQENGTYICKCYRSPYDSVNWGNPQYLTFQFTITDSVSSVEHDFIIP